MGKYLDKTGLQYFYGKLKEKFADKTTIENKLDSLTGALTWKGKFDTLPAVTDYEAGNVVGVGNKEYVLTATGTAKAWEELGDEGSYLLKSVAEETYAKKTSIPTVNNPKVSIKMNGAEKGSFTLNQASAGEVNLGTVLTEHQDISGKVDKTLNAKSLEGITIKTSNTTTDKAANVAAIQAYVDNLKALGVDTTKGYMIPISLPSTLIGIMVGRANTPCHAGFYRQSNSIGAGTSGVFLIKNDGEFQNISLLTAGSDYQILDTNHKNITGAINEVNKAVSDVNAAVKNIATIAEIDNLFVINTGSI